jgi:hypothetical protein
MPSSDQSSHPRLMDSSVYPQNIVNSTKHETIHGFSCLFPLQLSDEICRRLLEASRKKTQCILDSGTVKKTEFSGGYSFDVHRTN